MDILIFLLGALGFFFSFRLILGGKKKERPKFYPDPVDEKRRGIGKLERFIW